MALKNAPEFEKEPTAQAAAEAPAPAPAAAVADAPTQSTTQAEIATAGVEATTAIAVAATGTAVAAPSKAPKFVAAFSDLQDVFPTQMVNALSLSTPRLTGEQGSIQKQKKDYGKEVVIQIESWNYRWALGSGEDNKEANELFRVSYDKQTIYSGPDAGMSYQAYIDKLKASGHDKASMSDYVDIWGFVLEVDGKPVPEDELELVCLQGSQTTLGNFTSFAVARGLLASRGIGKVSNRVKATATPQTNKNGKKYTNFTFTPA